MDNKKIAIKYTKCFSKFCNKNLKDTKTLILNIIEEIEKYIDDLKNKKINEEKFIDDLFYFIINKFKVVINDGTFITCIFNNCIKEYIAYANETAFLLKNEYEKTKHIIPIIINNYKPEKDINIFLNLLFKTSITIDDIKKMGNIFLNIILKIYKNNKNVIKYGIINDKEKIINIYPIILQQLKKNINNNKISEIIRYNLLIV